MTRIHFSLALLASFLLTASANALTKEDILKCPPPTAPEFVRADEQGAVTVLTPANEQKRITGLPPCFQVEKNKLFSKASAGSAHVEGTRNAKKHCDGTPLCFHIQNDTHKPKKKAHRQSQRRP